MLCNIAEIANGRLFMMLLQDSHAESRKEETLRFESFLTGSCGEHLSDPIGKHYFKEHTRFACPTSLSPPPTQIQISFCRDGLLLTSSLVFRNNTGAVTAVGTVAYTFRQLKGKTLFLINGTRTEAVQLSIRS